MLCMYMYVNLYRCVYIWICHPSWIDQPDDHFMMSSKILVTAPQPRSALAKMDAAAAARDQGYG